MSPEEGLRIARERIAREVVEQSGILDLGLLGLTELPDELFALVHLRKLNLGLGYADHHGSALGPDERQAIVQILTSGWNVVDFAKLAGLKNLQSISCSAARLGSLAPLAELPNLQEFECDSTEVSDLSPLAGLPSLQSLDCSGTQVSDLSPLVNLTNLQSFDCGHTKVSDLSPLVNLTNLQSFDCCYTKVSDLSPLAGLTNLHSLNCRSTRVTDLAPLAGLMNLESLDCCYTQVSDLSPLAALTNLQSLNCYSTQVTNLAPLVGLVNLQSVDCSYTQVSDVSPLAGLTNLHSLKCSSTQVTDLAPLAGLPSLQSLDCSGTQVSTLSPLVNLTNLQSFDCRDTKVSDLSPLAGLTNLQLLDCSYTRVRDLAPLAGLPSLQSLDCSKCRLEAIPADILFKEALQKLLLYEAMIPGIPPEILPKFNFDNCIAELRAHMRDLDDGTEAVSDVKLMVLGNGRVGKTQLCRRLRGDPYDDSVRSTHGIIVTSALLRQAQGEGATRLQVWDFGGQDIYHGTHALFMRSRAIFGLVWAPEAEIALEHHHGGLVFRNHPLAYWLEYVRHFGGANSPVVIVQTRCEKSDADRLTPVSNDRLESFRPLPKIVHYSAMNERGRRALDEALAQCVESLREREGGVAVIGAGRAKVKHRIETMRDEDAARPEPERIHRTISYQDYLELCDESGGISEPKHLLAYLHDLGTVFYQQDLFENRIIIDQGWALESIYAVFDREKCYSKIVKQRGRFTRSDLAEWIWNAAGHGAKEQELLLSMMQSCGICFQYRPASYDGKIEAEFIAPDLLPEKSETEVAQKWDADRAIESATLSYPLLPQALMRGVTARIGSEAGLAADYWRDGVYIYEATTGSRGLIEQRTTESWQGEITAQTQRGHASSLLERLMTLIEEEQRRIGVAPSNKTASSRIPELGAIQKLQVPTVLKFAQEPRGDELFVSFAWGDGTPEGKRRQDVVERLCAAGTARGITILRDSKVIGLGDSIAKFMNRLAYGTRVFVVLSDKYLKSPYCMYELMEIWRRCFQEENRFLDRLKIIVLPDAKISRAVDRVKYAAYWREQRREIEEEIKPYGSDMTLLGEKDFKEYRMMQKFSNEVGDILAAIADRLLPRTYEQFEAYALDDLIGADKP
jgi:internalin A